MWLDTRRQNGNIITLSILQQIRLGGYPRIRGEKKSIDMGRMFTRGSPPHTRGKGNGLQIFKLCFRITPAYAGKSMYFRASSIIIWDHPRIRGEKIWLSAPPMPSIGSPPHTRGKVDHLGVLQVAQGITPAYAGKSCPPSIPSACARDHPRIRGEKFDLS